MHVTFNEHHFHFLSLIIDQSQTLLSYYNCVPFIVHIPYLSRLTHIYNSFSTDAPYSSPQPTTRI